MYVLILLFVRQVEYILELEGLHYRFRKLMKLPELKFKKRQAYWKMQKWWEKMWGIDFKAQRTIQANCQSACDELTSSIRVGEV